MNAQDNRLLLFRIDDNNCDHDEGPDSEVNKVGDGSESDKLVDLADDEERLAKRFDDAGQCH